MRQFSAYDSGGDRVVSFGGSVLANERTFDPSSAAWTLALHGGPAWDSLATHGAPPFPALSALAAFDPRARRLVASHASAERETYVLDLDRPTRRVSVLARRSAHHLAQAAEDAGGARRARGVDVAVLSEPGFDATLVDPATLRLDGARVARVGRNWRVRFADANRDGLVDLDCCFERGGRDGRGGDGARVLRGVDPEGFPLRGEVGASDPPRDGIAEETAERFVDEASFALSGGVPNPSTDGRFQVRFVLPSASPATLEVFDVTGRSCGRYETRGAGAHRVDVGGQGLPAGLYWLSLRQGGHGATSKAVVLR